MTDDGGTAVLFQQMPGRALRCTAIGLVAFCVASGGAWAQDSDNGAKEAAAEAPQNAEDAQNAQNAEDTKSGDDSQDVAARKTPADWAAEGVAAFAKDDYKQARYAFRRAAGEVQAEYHMGLMYEGGYGIWRNQAQASLWFGKAAEKGLREAQLKLARMNEEGRGTPRDMKLAAQWYEKAAEQGDVTAQARMGRLYWRGIGVGVDTRKAVRWLEKAAEQGDARARDDLERMAVLRAALAAD